MGGHILRFEVSCTMEKLPKIRFYTFFHSNHCETLVCLQTFFRKTRFYMFLSPLLHVCCREFALRFTSIRSSKQEKFFLNTTDLFFLLCLNETKTNEFLVRFRILCIYNPCALYNDLCYTFSFPNELIFFSIFYEAPLCVCASSPCKLPFVPSPFFFHAKFLATSCVSHV